MKQKPSESTPARHTPETYKWTRSASLPRPRFSAIYKKSIRFHIRPRFGGPFFNGSPSVPLGPFGHVAVTLIRQASQGSWRPLSTITAGSLLPCLRPQKTPAPRRPEAIGSRPQPASTWSAILRFLAQESYWLWLHLKRTPARTCQI